MDKQLPLKRRFQLPSAVVALLLQFVAFAAVVVSAHVFALKPTPFAVACCCGLIAAILSHYAHLPKWWLVIQSLFAPAVVATLALDIQPVFFLAGFLITVLVFWNAFSAQVPLYLSSEKVCRALERFLPPPTTDKCFAFADIGSGLGGVLAHLANVRPDGDYTGIESAPLPFLWGWLRIRLGGYRQCRVQWGDLWGHDLSRYDVVFAYLSPAPMGRLWQKAKAEMQPGSVFISSTFSVPGQMPAQAVQLDDLHRSKLLVWRM